MTKYIDRTIYGAGRIGKAEFELLRELTEMRWYARLDDGTRRPTDVAAPTYHLAWEAASKRWPSFRWTFAANSILEPMSGHSPLDSADELAARMAEGPEHYGYTRIETA